MWSMVGTWIQFGSLLIALVALIWQQRKAALETARKEKRLETKLRIFYALSENPRSEADILKLLGGINPLSQIDGIEVKKSLYEMLSDQTIRLSKSGKYQPRLRNDFELRGSESQRVNAA